MPSTSHLLYGLEENNYAEMIADKFLELLEYWDMSIK